MIALNCFKNRLKEVRLIRYSWNFPLLRQVTRPIFLSILRWWEIRFGGRLRKSTISQTHLSLPLRKQMIFSRFSSLKLLSKEEKPDRSFTEQHFSFITSTIIEMIARQRLSVNPNLCGPAGRQAPPPESTAGCRSEEKVIY